MTKQIYSIANKQLYIAVCYELAVVTISMVTKFADTLVAKC